MIWAFHNSQTLLTAGPPGVVGLGHRTVGVLLILVTLGLFSSHPMAADEKKTDAAGNSQVTRLAGRIREDIGWFDAQPSKHAREYLAALATMNYVQSRVSPLRYALLVKKGQKLPATAEEYLSQGAGICGGQVMSYRAILDKMGIRNRPVEFYLRGKTRQRNNSHIGVEVFYDGGWHFFDVTWGTFFRLPNGKPHDVLSIDAVLKASPAGAVRVTNRSDLWFQQWTAAGFDAFAYLKADKDLLIGSHGSIRLRPASDSAGGQRYEPLHQPNYVGRNNRSADFGSVTMRLQQVAAGSTKCSVRVLGKAGSGNLVIRGRSGQVLVPLARLRKGGNEIDLSSLSVGQELTLSVLPAERRGIGYLVFSRITLIRPAR